MKPTPLPPNPKISHRVEYVLQWLTSWMIIDLKGRPMLGGICTGLLLIGTTWGVAILIQWLTGHWK